MAENYGFFNAQLVEGKPDRVYEASDFAGYYASLIGNGVFANPSTNLQVMPNTSGLSVVIKSGKAFINGYWYNLTEEAQIALSTAPSSGIRYDAIILELSLNTRRIGYKYLEGISTGNPPQSSGFLTRNDNIYQVCLAYISVAAGATQINSRDITDTRPNNDYCGWVTGLVKQITTTDLFDQYNDAFNDWFESVKDLLDEADVYRIETQINSIIQLLNNGITTLKELNNGEAFRVWLGTTEEYRILKSSGHLLNNVLYLKTDDKSVKFVDNMDPTLSLVDIASNIEHFLIYKLSVVTDTSIYPKTVSYSTQSSNGAIVMYVTAGNAGFFLFEYEGDIYLNHVYNSPQGLSTSGWIPIVVNTVDSGWKTLTVGQYTTGFTPGNPAPQYRKIGKVVYVRGNVDIDVDNIDVLDAPFASLPSGYDPSKTVYRLVAGEGDRMARLHIDTSGNININYFKTYSGDPVTGKHWLQLDCEFLID